MARRQIETEYAVIGLGRFGGSLARGLEAVGRSVLGIDANMVRVQELVDEISRAVALDATDDDALREIDIAAFNTVIVALEKDFEATALITTSLKKMGIRNVICQAGTSRHRDVLLRIGANRVILAYEDSGARLAEELANPGMLASMSLGPNYRLMQVKPPERLIGHPVKEVEASQVTVAILLRDNNLMLAPDPATIIAAGDLLFVAGAPQPLHAFLEGQ